MQICPKNEEYFIKSFLKIYLLITINYTSREEIANTMKNIENKVMNREINIDDISEGLISKELYTNKFPGPDLLIWAFGEKRISKFMLWKIFFSKIKIFDENRIDFSRKNLKEIIIDFYERKIIMENSFYL